MNNAHHGYDIARTVSITVVLRRSSVQLSYYIIEIDTDIDKQHPKLELAEVENSFFMNRSRWVTHYVR